jgi:YtkA-like protein
MVALLLLLAGLAMPYDREGNFSIRFEPMAILQTGAPIPFHIKVEDARHQPVSDAKVTLQIETTDHKQVEKFRATSIGEGVYSAKPIFSEAVEWEVLVEVHRDDQVGARTINFVVSRPQN